MVASGARVALVEIMVRASLRVWCVLSSWILLGCAAEVSDSGQGGAVDAAASRPDAGGNPTPTIDARPSDQCQTPPTPAGPDNVIAPEFADSYRAYDLGPVPGVPSPLGGCALAHDDPDTMLIVGASETADGGIYSIGVVREPCGHIVGFDGTATRIADTPYADANLLFTADHLLIYSEWPQFMLSQLPDGAAAPARRTDLRSLGLASDGDQGPGGIGFVPPGLAAEGELRAVTWPVGRWVHVGLAADGDLFSFTGVTEALVLPNGPGGFAYVPAGSPEFDVQSIILAEWSHNTVAVYEADQAGDPIAGTRRDFFSAFTLPWGAYFEPLTGDYVFLSWGAGVEDRVFIVQGFVPPPIVE